MIKVKAYHQYGHKVTVVTPEIQKIDISTKVILESDVILSDVEEIIQDTISVYLESLRIVWEDNESLVVRISQIESKILNIEGVLDVTETTINGQTSNVKVTEAYLPILGSVEVLQ